MLEIYNFFNIIDFSFLENSHLLPYSLLTLLIGLFYYTFLYNIVESKEEHIRIALAILLSFIVIISFCTYLVFSIPKFSLITLYLIFIIFTPSSYYRYLAHKTIKIISTWNLEKIDRDEKKELFFTFILGFILFPIMIPFSFLLKRKAR